MGWDIQMRSIQIIDQVYTYAGLERMGWDNQMTSIQNIDLLHVQSGDG
jgi:hypothetical protein